MTETTNKNGRYPFATNTSAASKKWRDVKYQRCEMDSDMQRLYDAVAEALAAGLFYTKDVDQKVTDILGEYFDYPDDPEINSVEGGLRGMEIYYARKAVEHHRSLAKDKQVCMQLQHGQRLKDFRYAATTYSSAVVEEIDQDSGRVKLFLTKRGSRNRWTLEIGAARLADHLIPDTNTFALSGA